MIRVELDITFMTANEAVQDDPAAETARILREAAKRIEGGEPEIDGHVFDINGNNIGRLIYSVEDDSE